MKNSYQHNIFKTLFFILISRFKNIYQYVFKSDNQFKLRFCLVTFFIGANLLYTYSSDYLFSTIGLEEGLVHPSVKCVLRDSKDYLWIGTKGGLNRYDKGKMKTYRRNPSTKQTLPDNDLISIFEDKQGKIWVICSTGVAYYDRLRDSFIPYEHNGQPLRARSYLLVPSGVFFGGAGSIFFYDYETGGIYLKDTKGGSSRYYNSILPWTRDRYILTTRWDGIWIFNLKTSIIEPFQGLSSSRIISSLIDSEDNIWISVFNEGLYRIDRSGEILKERINGLNPNSTVLDILESNGKLWIATDGQGIITYEKNTGNVEVINDTEGAPKGLRSVNCLYKDNFNYIYAGTVRGGLACLYPSAMKTLKHSSDLDAMTVTSLVAEKNKIWMGIDGDGIVIYQPEKNDLITSVESTKGMKIVSIGEYDDNNLIVSTYDNGIFLLNKKNLQLANSPAWTQSIVEENMSTGIPIDIARLSGDKIAFITDRIYLSNITGNEPTIITADNIPSRLRVFYNDIANILCYSEKELYAIDLEKAEINCIYRLQGNSMECAAYDGKRYIYAGTPSGLVRYDFETNQLDMIGSKMPPGTGITALAYNDGKLWIGALGRLYMRDINTGETRSFGVLDGVSPNEFIYKATLATPHYLLMGGVNGLLKIDLNTVQENYPLSSYTPLTLGEVLIDGLPVELNGNEARLPDQYSTLRIRLNGGSTHPMGTEPTRFYIGRKSLDASIEMSDNVLNLGHLHDSRGGRYNIYASTLGANGEWTNPIVVGSIVIPKAWWRTPLAIILYILFILTITGFLLWYYLLQKRQRKINRQEKHKRQSLEKEVGFLMNLNYELRTPLTLIYSRLKLLIDSVRNKNIPHDKMLLELQNIYRNSDKMRDIINTTVDLWRSGDMNSAESPEKANVALWINKMLLEFNNERQEKRILINSEGLDKNQTIICDLRRATTVLHNVLMSTISHAAENSEITLNTNVDDEHLKIIISFFNDESHGAGEEFRYADYLMALMDGELTYIRNENGEASVIEMEFPIKINSLSEKEESKTKDLKGLDNEDSDTQEDIHEFDMSHLTAIVVEDDPELRELFVSSLSHIFKKVLEASNGKDALTFIKNTNPDLIISEARLPKMSGLELCRTIKKTKEYSHIPVIMLTTRLEEMSIANGNNYGADNYLTKPFDISVLQKRCGTVLKSFDRVKQWYKSQASDILPSDKRHSNEAETFILKIREIIEQNINVPGFGVDDIVNKMLVSRSTLYGKFKELTGQSLGNYINDYKLNRAKEFLSTTNMTMVEISDALGFATQRYFSTFFKDKTGMTPTSFRNQEKESYKN